MHPIGKLASIHRYPVKSMAGEALERSSLTPHGLEGDRRYAFESTAAPAGMLRLSGAERRAMLACRPELREDGSVEVQVSGGERLRVDSNDLLAFFEDHSPQNSLQSRFRLTETEAPQTDVRPLSLLSLQTVTRLSSELGQPVDQRRFRANLLIDLPAGRDRDEGCFPEDALVGQTLRLGGEATILIQERDPRCRLIAYDPADPLEAEPLFALMKLLDRRHQGRAGVYATVLKPGPIACGDTIWRIEP